MKSKINSRWVLLISTLVIGASSTSGQEDPWAKLQYKTAWVPIGALSQDKKPHWINALTFRVRSPETANTRTLPQVGDVIEVTKLGLIQLHLLDFATKGEERRLESPGAAKRQLSKADVIGPSLPVGTALQVQDVQLQKLSTAQFVWLRVSPAP